VEVLCRQLPVRTTSGSDAREGDNACSARTQVSQLPRGLGHGGGSDLGGTANLGA
jgi:hypothetical protein